MTATPEIRVPGGSVRQVTMAVTLIISAPHVTRNARLAGPAMDTDSKPRRPRRVVRVVGPRPLLLRARLEECLSESGRAVTSRDPLTTRCRGTKSRHSTHSGSLGVAFWVNIYSAFCTTSARPTLSGTRGSAGNEERSGLPPSSQ